MAPETLHSKKWCRLLRKVDQFFILRSFAIATSNTKKKEQKAIGDAGALDEQISWFFRGPCLRRKLIEENLIRAVAQRSAWPSLWFVVFICLCSLLSFPRGDQCNLVARFLREVTLGASLLVPVIDYSRSRYKHRAVSIFNKKKEKKLAFSLLPWKFLTSSWLSRPIRLQEGVVLRHGWSVPTIPRLFVADTSAKQAEA